MATDMTRAAKNVLHYQRLLLSPLSAREKQIALVWLCYWRGVLKDEETRT